VADSLWTETAQRLLERTASAEPTPGGGSVAMLAASFGVGLVIMALEVTRKRKDAPQGLDPLIAEGRRLLEATRRAADEDVEVFESYMAALRLPKASDEEKSRRREALAAAALRASEVPLAAARLCLSALALGARAAALAHAAIRSDVNAGALLLTAAGRAVLLNVDANLPSLADDTQRARLAGERSRCEAELCAGEAAALAER
jgi:formiminotetrahydrofolate cyclodeaminase